MVDIDQLVATTRGRGGGRRSHVDQFLEHVSDEHAEALTKILHDPLVIDSHASRVLVAFRDAEYPEFHPGMSEGAIHGWRERNA